MELLCDICFLQFDLNQHRPKSLSCGHTLCRKCVRNPALGKKCPTCRMDLATDPDGLPDNFLVIRMVEDDAPALGDDPQDPKVQQLRSGVDAGRRLVQQLRRMVPLAVASLNDLLDSAVANLCQTEEALRVLKRQAACGGGPTPEQVQLAVQLRDGLQLLSTHKYSVTAEQGGDTWKASSVELAPSDHVARLLLLQLRASEQLEKDDVYIGPPGLSILSIENDKDIDSDGRLKVDDILRDGPRWKNIRTLNLKGLHTEKLLRVLAPQLEELDISGGHVLPSQMEEVKRMTSLKRLRVSCDIDCCDDYPELPLQLEQLSIFLASAGQLRSVQRMPRLRSLQIDVYCDGPVVFRPPLPGGLLWLGLMVFLEEKEMMLSLISASAATLRELHINTFTRENDNYDLYFPELGPDLGACGLMALRRLVLRRPYTEAPCEDIDACLQQRQTLRDFLPSAEVVCYPCQKSYVLG